MWVSAGGHRDPPLRLRSGTGPLCLSGGTTGVVVTSAVDDYNVGFRGRAQGPAPTITVGGRPLCLSGGTTGDVVTSAVDDYNVDSRFRGNDEMRGGLWVSAGGHRDPAPTITVGDRPLCLSGGTIYLFS